MPASAFLSLLAPLLFLAPSGDHAAGFGGITEEDVRAHLEVLAGPTAEGRDSPSAGQTAAGDYIARVFAEAGLRGAGADGSFRIPFSRNLRAPVEEQCSLVLEVEGGEKVPFAFGADYVPLPVCTGEASGAPVFCGFGISAKKERYDDLAKAEIEGNVAVILEGEPRHPRKFEGPDVTPDADVHVKIKNLEEAGAVGVLVVRRPAPGAEQTGPLGYRYTWASWVGMAGVRGPRVSRSYDIPALEVTLDAASKILATDVAALAAKLDKSAKPQRMKPRGSAVLHLASAIERTSVRIDNVVGVLPGSDPDLADEYVVIGAHYDHVGVDQRGRIGFGADDNGSGTAALLEMVQALGASKPRRSILACAFSAEEDGLLGSKALADDPPVPRESLVAMLNLDMIGRGSAKEVIVLGTDQNPALGDVLKDAAKLEKPRIKAVTGKAGHLWERSDHYSFHAVGVPTLFFFEAPTETDNPDYHTWRDTIELVDMEKVARTARIAYNTAWLLAADDDRPPSPRD